MGRWNFCMSVCYHLNMNKGFGLVGILIGVAIVAVLVGGGFYYSGISSPVIEDNNGIEDIINTAENVKNEIEKSNTEITNILDETADWKTYRNEKYGFELKYPAEASVFEIDNPQGISVTEGFEDKQFDLLINYDWESRIQKLKNTHEFVLQEIEINGIIAKKFIFQEETNNCTVSHLIIETGLGQNFFFNNLVECPTHPASVDKQMFNIVKTLKILK